MCSAVGRVDEVVGEVEAWLDKLDHADLADIPAEHIGGFLDRITTLANRLDALRVATVGAVENSAAALYDGLRTPTWVANRTRCRTQQAQADLHQARTLRRLPTTADAFRAGRITHAHVAALVALHTGLLAEHLERDEWFLVGVAEACTFTEFTQILDRWRLAADPDGPEPTHQSRCFRLRPTINGAFDGTLRTDTLTGAELRALLERAERTEWQADWAEARRLHGDHATQADLPRTRDQRMHDALVTLLRHGAANPDGTEPRPVITVVVTEERLRDILEETAGLPTTHIDPVDAAQRDEPRLADGTPLHPHDLIRLAIRGFIRRVVIDPAGRPVALSSRQRLYTGPLRQALLGLAHTCSFPGCDTPAHRCEIDHITPWRTTGTTTAANGWPLCDHHQKHKERGFTPHRHPNGTTHWTRPDGTRIE